MGTPSARISINGNDITSRLTKGGKNLLVSLTVTDEAGIKSDTAELVIDNRDGFPAPPRGGLMEVWLGFDDAPSYMGKFRIDDWTKSGPPNILTVSAKSAELTTEIKSAKARSHHDTTLGDIVKKVAGDHGLGVTIDSSLASRKIAHIDQQTESDLNFLSRLARRNGATFKLADGKVIFAKKGSKSLPSGKAKPTRTVKLKDVTTWSMKESERGDYKSVVAYWHDHDSGERKKVTSGSGKPAHRLKTTYATEAEAQAAADGARGDFGRGKREGSITLVGDPQFFAETQVTMSGFDKDVDSTYTAKSVTHTFDGSGYTTSVSLEVGGDDSDDS